MIRKKYDIAVIGSGPGGQRAAVQAAKKGKKVVVIDRREYKLGGVSLHCGTIPSKTLREAVLYLRGIRRKNVYGQSHRFDEEITLNTLMERVDVILSYELKVIEAQLKRNGVDIIYGQGTFLDQNTVAVYSRTGEQAAEISARQIIIATGTVPRRPADIPFDEEVIFDSDFIFSSKCNIKKLPESLIVYGSGVIGSEYAGMFAALGCKVTLMDSHKELFPFLDSEIVSILKEYMEKMGMTIMMGQSYTKIEVIDNGKHKPKGRITTEDGTVVEADAVLFSKGRIPYIEPLALDKVGVEFNSRRTITVDDKYCTSVNNIYACGDVIGFPALASTSAEQGRVAARFALNLENDTHKPELFPSAIYTIPEISTVGKTERQLIEENIPYEKGIAYYREIAKAAIFGDDTGLLKILFHKNNHKLLGIHIIGEQAAEIVHVGQMVMAFEGTIDSLVENVFNYPTWAEAYKVAALNGVNKL